jgi:hypothetical protein
MPGPGESRGRWPAPPSRPALHAAHLPAARAHQAGRYAAGRTGHLSVTGGFGLRQWLTTRCLSPSPGRRCHRKEPSCRLSVRDRLGRSLANAVAETEEFALDALVPPARVLSGQPLDQLRISSEIGGRPVDFGVGPFVLGQAPVPGEQGARHHNPMQPKVLGSSRANCHRAKSSWLVRPQVGRSVIGIGASASTRRSVSASVPVAGSAGVTCCGWILSYQAIRPA